jgi:hypothetical protein
MSTLGKVLSVLTVLMILVWIVMAAGVADLNRNYGEKVIKLQGDIDRLEKQVVAAQAEVEGLIPQIALQQVERDKRLTVLREHLSQLEKLDTESREALIRVELQVTRVQAEVTASQAANALREKQKADTQKLLADARAGVQTLMGENAKLLEELTGLRTEYLSTVAENRELYGRLSGASPSATAPRVRPASLRRN